MNYSPEGFIKGKITELIFDEMFRRANEYTVIPFGYESSYPEIAQAARSNESKQVLENIRSAPDFALVSHDRKDVILVEVKYRTNPNDQDLIVCAEKVQERWKAVSLFLATPTGFYFDTCQNILNNKGKIAELSESVIGHEIQQEYHALLKNFIRS